MPTQVDYPTQLKNKSISSDWITGVTSKPVADVRQFASGSSTGGIQEAVNSLASTGGTVIIPPGVYTLSAVVNIPTTQGIQIIGAGYDPNQNTGTILNISGIGKGFSINPAGDPANDSEILLSGFRLYGAGTSGVGILVTKASWGCVTRSVGDYLWVARHPD
jgi:hypothetical protein